MARPLRLEFAGVLYHVTARGDRREDVDLDDNSQPRPRMPGCGWRLFNVAAFAP